MFGRTRLYHIDGDNPEQAVLERLEKWRKENPDAVIVGMQWSVTAQTAVCEVTFETPESKAGSNGKAG